MKELTLALSVLLFVAVIFCWVCCSKINRLKGQVEALDLAYSSSIETILTVKSVGILEEDKVGVLLKEDFNNAAEIALNDECECNAVRRFFSLYRNKLDLMEINENFKPELFEVIARQRGQ